MRHCTHCDHILTVSWLEIDGRAYCDQNCRDGAPLLTFQQYVATQRARGRDITGPIRRVAEQLDLEATLTKDGEIR
jgi:hypothetical protein